MGLSRDTFYRYRAAHSAGGDEALFEVSRKKPNLKNRVDEVTEQAVKDFALEFLAYGQVRASKELRKKGIFVSSSGVRSIWLRHDLESMKQCLSALERKFAEEGFVLTEAQVQTLERKKQDDEPVAKSRRPPRVSGQPEHVLCGNYQGRRAHLSADLCGHLLQVGKCQILPHQDSLYGRGLAQRPGITVFCLAGNGP